MRAQFYFRNGDYDRAIEDFSAFIHKYPNSDEGFNERGLSYAKKGEYDRAIADYTEAIRLNREPVGPYINRGSAYEKKGELDKALADFREALSNGSTTASEDIKRIEGAIQSLPAQAPPPSSWPAGITRCQGTAGCQTTSRWAASPIRGSASCGLQ